ncbi:MAG: NAD(P)-dependent oxidoreductase [Cellulomonadaceae bacterium]|nr:NAD(P)-dependent oxidoreductase [Cellulomonadaceae bacterium]
MTPADLVRRVVEGTDLRVAITGATGWFGATALDLLYQAYGDSAGERVCAYASAPRTTSVADGREVAVLPLGDLPSQSPAPSIILHFAYLTRDRVADLGVDAYVRANMSISATVLDSVLAHRPLGIVMTSSGAVYGSGARPSADVGSDPYGALKRVDELAFRAACDEIGATLVVPRVFSVAGARMTKPDKYALGSMIGAALSGGPVVVRASTPVRRSYCGVDEVVALAIWAAACGRPGAWDSGGTVVELGELARVVATEFGLDPASVVRSWDPLGPADDYFGVGDRMDVLAAEAGIDLRSLPSLVRATAEWLSQ